MKIIKSSINIIAFCIGLLLPLFMFIPYSHGLTKGEVEIIDFCTKTFQSDYALVNSCIDTETKEFFRFVDKIKSIDKMRQDKALPEEILDKWEEIHLNCFDQFRPSYEFVNSCSEDGMAEYFKYLARQTK